ncbi:MAG: DUF368 domain-containing protein [Prochlorococcaceae cyanobacterium]
MPEVPAKPSPRWPYVLGCGLAMGSADVVPGVSGGSMAFILGIYAQLLEAIAGFDLQLLALLRDGRWSAAAARVHLGFLVPLLAGLFSAVLILVRPITWLYEAHPVFLIVFVRLLRWLLERWHGQTVALLVGFMAGSLWKIWPFRTVLESTHNAKGKLIVLRDALAAPPDGGSLAVALLLGAVGVALVVGLEWLQHRVGVAEMGG